MKYNKGIAPILVVFISLVVIMAGLLVAYFLLKPRITNSNIPYAEDAVIPSDWKQYKGQVFSFSYPEVAKLEEQEQYLYVTAMGQEQIRSGRTQTELYDGYTFSIADVSENGLSLEDIFQTRLVSYKDVCDPDKLPVAETTEIDGRQALRYSASCLGDFTIYLVADKDKIYELSEMYVGSTTDQPIYKQITDRIVSSVKFVE